MSLKGSHLFGHCPILTHLLWDVSEAFTVEPASTSTLTLRNPVNRTKRSLWIVIYFSVESYFLHYRNRRSSNSVFLINLWIPVTLKELSHKCKRLGIYSILSENKIKKTEKTVLLFLKSGV